MSWCYICCTARISAPRSTARRIACQPLHRLPGSVHSVHIIGSFRLLESSTLLLAATGRPAAQQAFRFLHVSTDKIYGSLPFSERNNNQVVETLCTNLDQLKPRADNNSYREQIRHVHDQRYLFAPGKLQRQLGWQPQQSFETGIRKTVQWYLDNQDWVRHVMSGYYQSWQDSL